MYIDSNERQFGAWRLDDEAASSPAKFSLFFPDRLKDPSQYEERPGKPGYGDPKIQSIHVCGDFQHALGQVNWTVDAENALQRIAHPKGWVWTYTTPVALPAGFYQYKYVVDFERDGRRWVGDPCTRYGGEDVVNENAGFVIGPSLVSTTEPLNGPRKHPRDLIVYELNIDDFTDGYRYSDASLGERSALDAVRSKLDHLTRLGVNAILFLPWTAWASDAYSWGYTPYQYFSVEHRYTNDITDTSSHHESKQLSRLRQLVTECHRRGLHVIMDGVFNHVGPDISPNYSGFPYRWLYADPEACPYVGTFGGTFAGLKDLDYHNGCTQEFIRDVCFYWMDEFKIDGIRFDNTVNFHIERNDRGLPRLLADIQGHANDPDFSLTIEHLDMSAAAVANKTGATGYWNNALYECGFGNLWNGKVDFRLVKALDTHAGLNAGKVATTYLSNHDHSHVTWQCGARNSTGSMEWYRTQPYAIALLTAPGGPLIQNGQEFAEDHWIPEDDQNSGRRVKSRPLRWEFLDDPIGRAVFDLYQRLIAIRNAHAGLRSDSFEPAAWEGWMTQFNPAGYGIDIGKQVLIYRRWGMEGGQPEEFVVVLNFSSNNQVVNVPFPASGTWSDLLNDGIRVTVSGGRLRDWTVNSNWGHVFYKQG
jgi:pullulanase/glycogen debranching enzyme